MTARLASPYGEISLFFVGEGGDLCSFTGFDKAT